jgi:hypothetical protein
MEQYWLQLKNDKRGIIIQISGTEAEQAYPILTECIDYGMSFEWGGMQIETKSSDWQYRDSNTMGIGPDGPIDPWLSMGNVVQYRNGKPTKFNKN